MNAVEVSVHVHHHDFAVLFFSGSRHLLQGVVY